MNATCTRNAHGDSGDAPSRTATGSGLDSVRLQAQNRDFAGTGGVSANNRRARFVPSFMNLHTGVAVASRFANGNAAPVHVLEGMPTEWISERNAEGMPTKTCQGIVAGFIRFGRFYSRGEAAVAMAT